MAELSWTLPCSYNLTSNSYRYICQVLWFWLKSLMLICCECSSTSSMSCPQADWSGWRVGLQIWHTTDRSAFFILAYLLLREIYKYIFYMESLSFIFWSGSGAICWTSECRNLFCLQGKHLIPVPSRIYRSAKGRHYWLTLNRPGAGVKLLGNKYKVSCPALSRALGTGSMWKPWLMMAFSLSEMGCN